MKILIVDDDKNFRNLIVEALAYEEVDAHGAENGLSARRMLEEEAFTAVVTDLKMPGMNGQELLTWILEEGPAIPVVMMSGHGELQEAVEAMRSGAQDYIVKPFDPEILITRLHRIIEHQDLKSRVESGKLIGAENGGWIGASSNMEEIRNLIGKVAPTASTVLISGESGTGKEVIARAIHTLSPRTEKPFIDINVGAVPENLLESELFGHEKGAFTGADSRRVGLFEAASAGTLLLDEIGEMPAQLQVKLLRVLQERKIRRLGGNHSIPVDVRILAATNKRPEDLVEAGNFREDLFYRLNVIRVEVPPLRERRDDIALLAGHFLKKFNRAMGKSIQGIGPKALKALQTYDFPGNVRELENLLERAVILADSDTISLGHLGLNPPTAKYNIPKGSLADIEKQAILDALDRWEGNRTHAAKELGISRKTLIAKIKAYKA